MVNIEIRQNNKFSFGYPYNHEVDTYFEPLSNEFISAYNLTSDDIEKINTHKNDVFNFDGKLTRFLFELSTFISEFKSSGQPIIDAYNDLKKDEILLKKELTLLTNEYDSLSAEFNYIDISLVESKDTLLKLDELLQYYKTQTNTITNYVSEYTDNISSDLDIITDTLTKTEASIIYYDTILNTKIDSYLQSNSKISKYTFDDISLRNIYEAWVNSNSPYFNNLIDYFKSEYDGVWTYGKSLMYNENLSYVNAAKSAMDESAIYNSSLLIKKYTFQIEKNIKEYALNWISNHLTIDEKAFEIGLHTEKRRNIKNILTILHAELDTATRNMRNVVTIKQEQDFYIYQELIENKRRYIYTNLTSNTIDNAVLATMDNQIISLKNNYNIIKLKFESNIYWTTLYRMTAIQSTINEMDKMLTSVEYWFNNTIEKTDVSADAESKILFYTTEISKQDIRVIKMISIKNDLDIKIHDISDKKTIITSKLFENTQSTNILISKYETYFNNRLKFFTHGIDITSTLTIFDLLNGKYYNYFHLELERIKKYNHKFPWINVSVATNLFDYYTFVVNSINTTFKEAWKDEFSSPILNNIKFNYYETYFNTKLHELYGSIHKFFLDNTYSLEIYDIVKQSTDKLKSIFSSYVDIAFYIHKNIELNTDIFNYDNTLIFSIDENNESLENVKTTFEKFIDNIVVYVYNGNNDLKLKNEMTKDYEKINTMWNDMEKKYV